MTVRGGLVIGLVTLVTVASARADSLDAAGVTARGVARAGAVVVSADDGGALLVDPAGLARRVSLRAQVGITLVERSARFESDATFTAPAAAVTDRAGVDELPWGSVQIGIGERVTIGAGWLAPTDVSYAFAAPPDEFDPAKQDAHVYPHRYGGLELALRRTTAAAGVGVRVLPWLAAGAAALVSRVSLRHGRMISAEPAPPGATLGNLLPAYDMFFSASASDWVPGATVGVLLAPLDVPIELAASLAWSADAELSGTPRLSDTRGWVDRAAGVRQATAQVDPAAKARLTLPLPSTFRAGARFLGDRTVVELQAEAWRVGHAAPVWDLDGVSVTPDGGEPRDVAAVPLGPLFQDGYALRAAVDVDVVAGVLAVTAGYAYASRLMPRTRQTPVWPDAAAHTFSLGVEGRVAGALVTLGLARTERAREEVPAGESGVTVVAPFAGAAIPAGGAYDGAVTTISLGVELERL